MNYWLVKNVFDRFVSFVAFVFLLPFLLVVAFFVRWRLGTPVIFCQKRPGLYCQPFFLFKFRTMTNCRDSSGVLLSDSERLTPFGRWLRATSIDELPELINILRGEMSFIGPRPLLMNYLPLYSTEQLRRHLVKPGFSGLAQINGRNAITWEERFSFDLCYVEHQNFWLDMKIFFVTLWKVLRRDGISASGEATMAPFTGTQVTQ